MSENEVVFRGIPLVSQPTPRSSWAAAVSMLWAYRRRRKALDPLVYVSVARGGPLPRGYFTVQGARPGGVEADGFADWPSLPAVLSYFGLRRLPGRSPSAQGWRELLSAHGPLLLAIHQAQAVWGETGWNTSESSGLAPLDEPHAMIVYGTFAYQAPPQRQSEMARLVDSSQLSILDPWPPGEGSDFVITDLPTLMGQLARVSWALWALPPPAARVRPSYRFGRG